MTIVWQSPNGSAAEGILQPLEGQGPRWETFESATLENWLQHWVAAVAHVDGELTRPRWQPQPPNIPDFDTPCWLTLGIIHRRPLGIYAWVGHDSRADPHGNDQMQRHEEIEVACSFYGPEADYYATNFHSGLMIWQNTHMLRYVGMAFADIGEAIRSPEYIKEQWLNRIDKMLTLRRIILRKYPVFNIARYGGWVNLDVPPDKPYRSPFHGDVEDDDDQSGC